LSTIVESGHDVRPVKTLRELEENAIRDALAQCHGNKSSAAKLLGISRKALYKRLSEMSAE